MRLVVEYVEGDGCTYHCNTTVPLECDSAEAFIVEFEEQAHKAFQKRVGEFVVCNRTFPTDAFFHYNSYTKDHHYHGPSIIMTVDEWFASRE